MPKTLCRMSLYPMCGDFVDLILGSVRKVDTSKVQSSTDHLSTLYRGQQSHVLDCARSLFCHAWKENVHMVGEFTFSDDPSRDPSSEPAGSPGEEVLNDNNETQDVSCNDASNGDFYAYAKMSFYPLGEADYTGLIRSVTEFAEKRSLNPKTEQYVTILEGRANELFNFINEALSFAHRVSPHFVFQVTLSVNSPSAVHNIRKQTGR